MKKIGIIGGAGVAAANKLCELVEIELTKNNAFRDCHHPEMIIYQATQAPSRSMFLEGKGPSFVLDYIMVASKLKSVGADIVAMNCNTAHFAIQEIQEKSNIPFINLIEEVVIEAKKTGKKNIGLIASDGCLKGKLYEKYFEKLFPQANLIYPDDRMQKEVTKGICNIKNKNRFKEDDHIDRPKNIFSNICKHLKANGADVIIIGCTDIRVDFTAENLLDSLEILAKTIIRKCDGK